MQFMSIHQIWFNVIKGNTFKFGWRWIVSKYVSLVTMGEGKEKEKRLEKNENMQRKISNLSFWISPDIIKGNAICEHSPNLIQCN